MMIFSFHVIKFYDSVRKVSLLQNDKNPKVVANAEQHKHDTVINNKILFYH
jgi:hypothetical protein